MYYMSGQHQNQSRKLGSESESVLLCTYDISHTYNTKEEINVVTPKMRNFSLSPPPPSSQVAKVNLVVSRRRMSEGWVWVWSVGEINVSNSHLIDLVNWTESLFIPRFTLTAHRS
jgi:hypothetical protein